MINMTINNIEVSVPKNTSILDAAKKYSIKIPTLCYYPDLDLKSDCRVCVVEIEGQKGLVTSCSTNVREGLVIKTNSPRVLNARKVLTELILANHDGNCTACQRNLNCELQTLSNKLGIDQNRFSSILDYQPIDDNNPSLVRNLNRCIKCGRCVDICKSVQGMNVLEIMGRGHEAKITPAFGRDLSDEFCTYCGQCASVCPVGAITEKDDTDIAWAALHNPKKHVIVQVAPAVRVSIGEEFGNEPGTVVTGKMVSAIKHLGFDFVFDTNFTADLTIMEEGSELIHRITTGGKLPLMTSCCPGWITFAEQRFPDLLENVSTCKSPQQMFGTLAKTYYANKNNIEAKDVFVVSVMPCTAKKFEASREEMKIDGFNRDVDVVLTTRELAKMIRQMGIDFNSLEDVPFDSPFGITTGAAALFGATGGVAEAALRTVSEIVNNKPLEDVVFKDVRGLKGIKEAVVKLGDQNVKIAVVHTLENARIVCEQIRNNTSPYAFIEIMCCPGGCIGGGGQPYGTTNKILQKRIDAVYSVDEKNVIRKSHENPYIAELYRDFLGKPLEEKAHHLLHTKYSAK